MWKTVKIWKSYTKLHCVKWCEPSLSAEHKAAHYQLWLFVSYVQPLWLYTGICLINTCMNNQLNQFITAQEVDFLIISTLFSFLYLSNSITGKVANKKLWKNHKLLLHTLTILYPNFSSICSLQLKKWTSWLLAFSFLYLSSSITGKVENEKFWKNHRVFPHTPTISHTNFSSIYPQ